MAEFIFDVLLYTVPGLFWAILAGLVTGTTASIFGASNGLAGIVGIAGFVAFLALAITLKIRSASRSPGGIERPD
jgi:predicted lipid-binding transport protein (Tim44 family)